jgi:glycosyltransferase involved in cell wall biosynthesis
MWGNGLKATGLVTHPANDTGGRSLRLVSIPAQFGSAAQAEVVPVLDRREPYLPLSVGHPLYQTLTIILPVFNERNTVLTMLDKVFLSDTAPLAKEVFIVDDCSTDGTRELLKSMDWESLSQDSGYSVKLLLHEQNCGKGACVRTALKHAKGELVLVQDADLEYDPADYPALLRPILAGDADAVFGNRFHPGAHRVPRYYRFLLNRVFSILCNLLTSLALTDVTACYKVLRRDVLDSLALESNRFSMETELTVKLAKTGARIYEVPIMYHGRTYAEGKKISWVDGLAATYHLFRYRFF